VSEREREGETRGKERTGQRVRAREVGTSPRVQENLEEEK